MKLDSCSKAFKLALRYGFYDDCNLREIWVVFVNADDEFITSAQIDVAYFRQSMEINTSKIYDAAVKCKADGIILYTNHDSRDVRPTSADISLTKALIDALKNHNIRLIDHIIVSNNRYYSFAEDRKNEIQ